MKVAVMQPYIFPYIGYFQLISTADKFVILDDVNFIKKGWINRNNILLRGRAYLFTVPLIKASQNKLIRDIDIFEEEKWKEDFLQLLKQNYSKAKNYTIVFDLIEEIFRTTYGRIADINTASLKKISNYLGIDTDFSLSSDVQTDSGLKGSDRIINICKKLGAAKYLNAIGGMELYNKKDFSDNEIELSFLKSGDITYDQFGEKFVPSLSILDVMMFNSTDSIKSFLKKYIIS